MKFFKKIKKNGTLGQLIDRYYGHIGKFDYVGTRSYQAHIEQRLPAYRELFKRAAKEVGIDWRLLAAVGYQESHWDPDAVSPAGARGLMMLTGVAATDLDIDNRTNPEQSILGGARYLQRMLKSIPDRIPAPDRTWLALAAYNVGHPDPEKRWQSRQVGGREKKPAAPQQERMVPANALRLCPWP